MRRLLQLGTFLLLLAVALTPLLEFFDRWDAPGLENDTEMAIFGLVLLLCLVLAVCRILGNLSDRLSDVLVAKIWPERSRPLPMDQTFAGKLVVPPVLTTLRV